MANKKPLHQGLKTENRPLRKITFVKSCKKIRAIGDAN